MEELIDMNPDDVQVDVNVLVKTLSDKMTSLYKENALLEAKFQSLIQDYHQILEDKRELQAEIEKIKREQ
jgi:predicted nuclease with TOPRIM domain